MGYILSIDTSTPACSIAVHLEGKLIGSQKYNLGKSHSSLLPGIIDQLLRNIGIQITELKATAICSGPGSYTGLRIGASIAKGICYSLDIPMIAVNSLQLITDAVFRIYGEEVTVAIAAIDARREEVYTHAMGKNGLEILPAEAMILKAESYDHIKKMGRIYVAGDGAKKCKELVDFGSTVSFKPEIMPGAEQLGISAYSLYLKEAFEDIAYFEPFYLKEFYTTQKIKN